MVLNGFIESLLEHYIHGNRYTENDSSLFPENLAVAESCGRISAFLRSEVQISSQEQGIVPVNIFALMDEMVKDPGDYGFTNTDGIACTPVRIPCAPTGDWNQ